MPLAHPRSIVRRAVMALAAVVLLVASYISSWGALHWLMGRGTISIATYGDINGMLYSPLLLLMETDTISARFLIVFAFWCMHKGGGGSVTFSEFWQAAGEDAPAD